MRHKWDHPKVSKEHPINICLRCGAERIMRIGRSGVGYISDAYGYTDKAMTCKPNYKNKHTF